MGMRGDLALHLRLLVRPAGIVGSVGVLAGATAVLASYLPWYEVTADVAMLGARQGSAIGDVLGWQAHPWGWLLPTLGVAAMVVGLRLAIDRPWAHTTELLLATGLGIATIVAVGGLAFPPVSRFDVGDSRLRELTGLADRLPRDVDLSFAVHPGQGMWVALAAAALLLVTAAASWWLS